ncbi:hypothetical protein [Granulicella arctica]|uniref:hypothetical protein n=1 Tax=Granulicella arctica TaxID=940613 RepID=UPI0021E0902F|nr:hypothetical protein [Granulicella arctica]
MSIKKRLQEIVNEIEKDPYVRGRLACGFRSNDLLVQKHRDKAKLEMFLVNKGSFWRCTIWPDNFAEACLVQVDLYFNGMIRVEAHQSCSVMIDPEEQILSVTRLVEL